MSARGVPWSRLMCTLISTIERPHTGRTRSPLGLEWLFYSTPSSGWPPPAVGDKRMEGSAETPAEWPADGRSAPLCRRLCPCSRPVGGGHAVEAPASVAPPSRQKRAAPEPNRCGQQSCHRGRGRRPHACEFRPVHQCDETGGGRACTARQMRLWLQIIRLLARCSHHTELSYLKKSRRTESHQRGWRAAKLDHRKFRPAAHFKV